MYKIDDLVDKVNSLLAIDKKDDARINKLSIRRVRDYMTKNMISKPIKKGKEVFFTDEHLNQLLMLRHFQNYGVSEKLIKKEIDIENNQFLTNYVTSIKEGGNKIINENTLEKNDEANSAMLFLNSFNSYSNYKSQQYETRLLNSNKLLDSISDNQILKSVIIKKVKKIIIDSDIEIIVEDREYTEKEKENILNKIRRVL